MGKRFSAGGPMRFGDGESDASDAIQTNLRQSVFAYARELRLRGENPETMLVHVKGAVADATVDVRMGRALFNQIVSWSIEAYFAF